MAIRNLLAINKLEAFKKFLEAKGYLILPTSNFEAIRAKKDKDTIIVFRKISAGEHLSIMDKDYIIVKEFIREEKEKKKQWQIQQEN